MTVAPTLSPAPIEHYLEQQQQRDVLRFITCGSVDDGKSTLIGRLLHDTQQIRDDQLAALQRISRRHGTTGGNVDLALLVDGLAAEREQGITIDVAYRYFSTGLRSFIVADTPGHEQYTRNMATGASTADVAVLLVDARQGMTRQTRRHALIASLLGVRRVVIAVNKMDLVGWSEDAFDNLMADFLALSVDLRFSETIGIPLSALNGDNVVTPGVLAPWYDGPTLLSYLEQVPVDDDLSRGPFRMPVQWVSRPDESFRGYAGLITSGSVARGDPVHVAPLNLTTRVTRILTPQGEAEHATAGQSVTLVLSDALDVSRGTVLSSTTAPATVSETLQARVFCTGGEGLAPGQHVLMKIGAAVVGARVFAINARIDPEDLSAEAVATLAANDVGDLVLSLDRPVAVDPYDVSRGTGGFIIIDRESAATLAIGLIHPAPTVQNQEKTAMPDRTQSPLSKLFSKLRSSTLAAFGVFAFATSAGSQELLNVSYDPTRELYREINQVFAADWKQSSGETVTIRTSHGGSGRQARSVIDGLNADVVTLALAGDIDEIARLTKKLPEDWQKRLPNNASPYTSTIVFVVRKGNPKGVKDWDDLAKPGLQVITPNPKTSGGARWNYLAAWAYGLDRWKDEAKARDFVAAIYKNVPVLDTGARGSTTTFAQRGLGDVFISWENEAFLTLKEFGEDKFEIVVPSLSILAEPPVALVDANVDAKGTRKAAQAYLDFLYTPKAQAIIAKHFYRPVRPEAAAREDIERLPKLRLITIDDVFGGWAKAQKTHFDEGGIFDGIVKANR